MKYKFIFKYREKCAESAKFAAWITEHSYFETFAQKPSSKNAIKLPTSQSELQSITSY